MKFYQIFIGVVCLVLSVVNVNAQCGFDISDTSPCGLEPVTFDVQNPNNSLVYLWDFGDPDAELNNLSGSNDNTAMGTSVMHSFTTVATGSEIYTVTLYIIDGITEVVLDSCMSNINI
ncbi:MAG: hypothetical protein ACI95T_001466, partial [Flavobacteriales bacterium]